MKCINENCDAEYIEPDDNFCYKCGHWTARGYTFLKDKTNEQKIINGIGVKKDKRFRLLVAITSLSLIIFTIMSILRGDDLWKPMYFVKRKVDSYIYGYNTAIIKNDNIYNKKIVNNLDDALVLIQNDLENQNFKCSYALKAFRLEDEMESKHAIPNVSLCDVSYNEVLKIKNVIDRMYYLFPNIDGALTNISITNAKTKEEYIAYFQPMFQFVNPNEDINNYNKVNKTQILLNSYYFLNENIMQNSLDKVVGDNWYVKDATWESTIAHELGHYITFVIFLRENGLENITFVTKENESEIKKILNEYETGDYENKILEEATNNYNSKYNVYLDPLTFALTISKYAGIKDNNDKIRASESIAEAIHDYYLHENNCASSSYEIVRIIKSRLSGEK